MTMMVSSSSVVRTVSLLPREKTVDLFLNVAFEEKKLFLCESSVPIRSSFSAVSSNCTPDTGVTTPE